MFLSIWSSSELCAAAGRLIPKASTPRNNQFIPCERIPASGLTACGKNGLVRHSERSEESLLHKNPRKEGFLTSQTPFGMTEVYFIHGLSTRWHLIRLFWFVCTERFCLPLGERRNRLALDRCSRY